MAFEINDLKGNLILALFAIQVVAPTNINCSGRAFHCVNSTHFMICVDLGGGLSTTIDDFVIPCPASTVCHENNVFECDFPEVTTPPLQVIGVYKQSDTSESTLVTSSVTAPSPLSEIFSVFKEKSTATILSIPEDVTPVVKLEVLENIKNPVGVISDNTTEASFKVTSSFIDSTNEVVKDKQTSNHTITTSAPDKNKNLEPAVENSIHNPVNTSSIDQSKSIDTVTTVIGLINLISTDLPSVVNTKPSSDVLTSLATLYDNIATTTEQYITKQVTLHGAKVENITEKIIIPTEIIFNERSVTTDEINTTPVVNTYIESNINTTEFIHKIDSGNQTYVGNSLGKNNNTSEPVPETTTEYLTPIVNILEPVTRDLTPHTTTNNTFVAIGLVDLIIRDPKQNAPSTNDYKNTFYGFTAVTTHDQSTTKLETTLRDKAVTAEVISTTPIINTIYQNILKNDVSHDFLTELNSTVEITLVKKVPETNVNYSIPELVTLGSLHTTTEKSYGPITTEANIIYTTETNDLIKNDLLVEKLTTATQPLEIITTTESPIELTDNLYQIKREMNQTMITAQNNTASAINTTERLEPVFNTSSTDIINNKGIELTLLPPITMKNPAIELTIAETLQKGLTANATEVKNELHTKNALIFVDEPYVENVNNDTLLYYTNTANTINATETIKTVFNNNGSSNEPPTEKQSAIKISATINLQNDFTSHGIEARNELPATNVSNSVNEPNFENVGINALLSVQATPAPYNVTSAPVTNETVNDLALSDIVTNPKTGYTPEIIVLKVVDGFTSLHQATTQKVRTDPESKILGSLSQPENLVTVSLPENSSVDILIKTVVHEDVVGMTTTYWKENENSATTPLSSGVTDKTSVKSDNQDNSSVIKIVNTQDILPETLPPLTELTSTTSASVHTTSVNVKSTKVFEQVLTNTPELLNINSVPTTDYKIESSILHPIDVSHITNIENDTVIPVTTLAPQEATGQNIATVEQLITTSTTSEKVDDLVSSTVATAGYVVFNTSDLNTSNWKDSVNIETVISKVFPNADVNKNETVNPMNGKNNVNASLPVIITNKDESSKIVSHLTVVNSSENVKQNGTWQPTSSNSTLSNDNIKTTESHGSKTYVTATENVSDYKYLLETIELVTQKNPEEIVSLAQTNVTNTNFSTQSTLPITEKTVKVQYVGTEAPLSSTVELKHIINPTETAVNYVSEKANDYISSTEVILTKLNKLTKVDTDSSVSSVSDFTPASPASHKVLKTVPVYDGVTIRESAFIMSSTEVLPRVMTENNIKISTESPLLTSQVMKTQTVTYNTEPSLPISELPPVPQMITDPTHTSNVVAQTTPKINQDLLSGITTVDLPQYVTSTFNNNIPILMTSQPIVGVTAAQITTEPTQPTNVFAQTTPVLAAAGSMNLNQGVLSGIETTDLPQNALSTVNKNMLQSMPLLPIVGLAAARMAEPTHTTNIFAQTPQPLDAASKTNQDVFPGIKTTDFLQSVMTVNNDFSQSIESLPFTEVTASQITTEPTQTTTVFPQTTSLLAAAGNTSPSEIETTDLPQYVTTTAAYKSTQWISDITTETITDSLTVPDSMVETIKVVRDKGSGTYLGDKTFSDVMSYYPTVNNANYSQKSVKNIIDHESIVIGNSSKNRTKNTPITLSKSVNINKAEIVNHTESNWLPSDVNIDSVKRKESSIEEDDTKSSVSISGTDVQNKTLASNSSITSTIETKYDIPGDKIEYKLTTVKATYKEVESGDLNNVTQSKTIITKENKNTEIDSPINANIEIIDVKKYQIQVDSKNISDIYNINNITLVNIITSHNNLSLQNSTTNDELEQHLMSRNHTITTEVQTHSNESDKQSNKTSDELTVNITSMHNPHITSIKLNASSNNTSAIKVSAVVFNCSNYTRGKYADKKDCRKFYTCISNLKPIIGICPNNTVFSEINKQCTRNLSHCVRNNQFRCLLEGRFSDFFKDNIYYICVKNRMHGFIRYKIQCQDGYHLNKDLVRCEKNVDISTISASSVSEMSNDESKPQLKLEKLVSKDDFECENEGKFPYIKNCSKYYVCDEIQNVYYICVKNKINGFIRYKLQCHDDYHLNKDTVKCEKNQVVSTHSSLSETNNDDSKPKSQKIVITDDFECVNEGKFPFAKDCSKYYECTKIKNVYRRKIKICAGEEVFDKKKKKCVESDSREC